jgi:hypothetical protein
MEVKLVGGWLKYLSGEYEKPETREEVSLNLTGRCASLQQLRKKN